MTTFAELVELFWALVGPWQFLYVAFSYLPPTIVRLFKAGETKTLLSYSRLQHAWFSAFWAFHGPRIREGNGPRITALMEGRVTKASVVPEPVGKPLSGVVLDIGPGPGIWVDLFARAKENEEKEGLRYRGDGTKLKVYGVEPNTEVHAQLRQKVRDAGIEDTYEIVPAGIQSLPQATNHKIEKESVDCIISLLCLCSIPEPEENIAELYKLLKKGGRWYVFEHVKMKGPWPIRLYQRIVNLVWPHALAGCQLCRDTESSLRRAGPWSSVDLAQPPDEPWHRIVPHTFGTLTK